LNTAGAAALALLLAVLPVCASGQSGDAARNYPNRPITLVVPFSPGTGIDILARTIGPRLVERWKQPVIVDNKPGASGNIGSDIVAKAAPNGHTLMVTVNTFALAPALYKNLPFDPATDFAAVGKIALGTYALTINPSVVPAVNLGEALASVKSRPGKMNYGSPGSGTPQHVVMELLKLRLGLDMVHVPYKGAAGATTDLLSGQLHMMFLPAHTALPHIGSGRLRILAVTGSARSALVPDVPTFQEQGIDFMDIELWYGVLAPSRTPPDIIAKLNQEIISIMGLPEVRDSLIKQGLVSTTGKPEEFAALIRSDLARWKKIVDDANITAD